MFRIKKTLYKSLCVSFGLVCHPTLSALKMSQQSAVCWRLHILESSSGSKRNRFIEPTLKQTPLTNGRKTLENPETVQNDQKLQSLIRWQVIGMIFFRTGLVRSLRQTKIMLVFSCALVWRPKRVKTKLGPCGSHGFILASLFQDISLTRKAFHHPGLQDPWRTGIWLLCLNCSKWISRPFSRGFPSGHKVHLLQTCEF